jgi:catechol 2,3-dioxygenase-like lactoylglutathione lyase family enzyme
MAALATYKDLCIDAADPGRMGEFWAAVLGLRFDRLPDDDVVLRGPTEQHTVWVNRVPEPRTVKQRVHLDVHARTTDDVLAAGATAEDLESFRWQVLRDPEGGELCVFERETVPAYRLYEVAVDAADHEPIARWWTEVLGATFGTNREHGFSWAEQIPGAPFQSLVFASVPEPKQGKNRIHWDVDTASLDALVGAGATILRERGDGVAWTVLADPEGNEFCAFTD